jgi:hypothetical protein
VTEGKTDVAPIATAATLLGLGVLAAYAVMSGYMGKGFAVPVGILGVVGGVVVMLGPVGKAIAARISGRADTGLLPEEAEEILARLHELEQGQARIAELEERLDFTERLLARQKDQERLP